jgi:ketosteroid isomerase-like protein
MSEENVEIVRRAFEDFGDTGIEGLVSRYSADAIIYSPPEWVEDAGYRGHEGLRKLIALWTQNFDHYGFEVQELRAVEGGVVALFSQTGKIKGSNAPVHQALGAVYSDFRDGRIGQVRFFLSWKEALEAAGLSE